MLKDVKSEELIGPASGMSGQASGNRGRLGELTATLERLKAIFFALAMATVFGLSAAHAQSEPVTTTSGLVQGNAADAQGIISFKGIPYAAPPVGRLRWHAPEPAPRWAGVRLAGTYGHSCFSAWRPNPSQSEDCLTVNVWTPKIGPSAKIPVMVYIYGGGFEFGTSADPTLDGSHLATHNVVVVTFNYRTGVLGFLATAALDQEFGTSGNWGLMDQLAALRWVKQNIANFGGDPNRVTVFGESAGAHAIGLLLASPKARGLIDGAILESGAFWEGGAYGSIATHREALALGAAFAQKFPGKDLRSIDAATLNAAAPFVFADDPTFLISPSIDGNVIPVSPMETFAEGHALSVPMLAGWNAAEFLPFTAFALPHSTPQAFYQAAARLFGNRCLAQFKALYPANNTAEAQASAYKLDGDLIIAEQTWEALRLSRHPGAPNAYAYKFTFTSPYSPIASHAAEIPYVWGTTAVRPQFFAPKAPPAGLADQQISDLMMKYWTNFAQHGDPNGPGVPFWPVFNGVGSQVMDLSATPSARPDSDEKRFLFIASYRRNGRLPAVWRSLGASNDQYSGIGCQTLTP